LITSGAARNATDVQQKLFPDISSQTVWRMFSKKGQCTKWAKMALLFRESPDGEWLYSCEAILETRSQTNAKVVRRNGTNHPLELFYISLM
jgi:hypothetical protein